MSISKIKTTYTRRQTERALLGSAMSTPEILDRPELALLHPEHFSVPGHREIWRAVRALRTEANDITPEAVQTQMYRFGADDLANLFGISTAPVLLSALSAIEKEADRDHAIDYARTVLAMGENLKLVDQLEELSDAAKAWPPTARAVFCDAFDSLAAVFSGAMAGEP
jgi:DnaB-like helicase N terminal domain